MTAGAQVQLTLPIGPRPTREFDNFVAGANAAALAHLQVLATACHNPGAAGSPPALTMPPPVYLWGPPGSGKSHLLQALAARVRERGGSVVWFDARSEQPLPLAPDTALLVLDGCDGFDAPAQHNAFRHFVDATTQAVQVAAAGRLPPVDLLLRDDLRTRLGWGLVFALEPLCEADTRRALLQETAARGIGLAEGVVSYLLTHVPRDLSHLMDLLDRLDDLGLARHRHLTVPLVREAIGRDIGGDMPVTGPAGSAGAFPVASPSAVLRSA